MHAGTKLPVVAPAPLLPGGVATYGFLRGLLPTLRAAQAEERDWVYADRGYLGASYGDQYWGHFRLTRNAMQCDGATGEADPARFAKLGVRLQPWRRVGTHVLVCPPGDVFTTAIGGFAAATWLTSTLAALLAATDRPVRVRHKPVKGQGAKPLSADLDDCHALVTYVSNTAVEALVAGVPVFVTGRCAASAQGLSDLQEIERPLMRDDRDVWAARLAANQWTLKEVRAGAANHLFR